MADSKDTANPTPQLQSLLRTCSGCSQPIEGNLRAPDPQSPSQSPDPKSVPRPSWPLPAFPFQPSPDTHRPPHVSHHPARVPRSPAPGIGQGNARKRVNIPPLCSERVPSLLPQPSVHLSQDRTLYSVCLSPEGHWLLGVNPAPFTGTLTGCAHSRGSINTEPPPRPPPMPGPGGVCREGGGLGSLLHRGWSEGWRVLHPLSTQEDGRGGGGRGLGQLMAREGAVRTARGSPSPGLRVGVQQAAPLPCSQAS